MDGRNTNVAAAATLGVDDRQSHEEDEANYGNKMVPSVLNSVFCAWAFESLGDNCCVCCQCEKGKVKQESNGYTNLLGHFTTQTCCNMKVPGQLHPNYNIIMQPIWQDYHTD